MALEKLAFTANARGASLLDGRAGVDLASCPLPEIHQTVARTERKQIRHPNPLSRSQNLLDSGQVPHAASGLSTNDF